MKLQIGVMCIVFISLATNIQPMVLKGQTYSRYDPCGLGTVHFDKVANSTRWMGVFYNYLIHIKKTPMPRNESMTLDKDDDPQIDGIEIYIRFRDLVTFSPASLAHEKAWISTEDHNSTIVTLKPRSPLPKKYIFFVNVPSEKDVPVVTELKLNEQTLCSDYIRALQAEQFNKTHNEQKVCGSRSLNHVELVTTDAEAKRGEWPWYVAVLFGQDDKTSYHRCSGSIVSKTAVLTAGRCIENNKIMLDAKSLMVLAGTNNMKDRTSEGAQLLKAEEVIVHPSYSINVATADLAIIKVAGFHFTEYVQPVCLWGPTYDKARFVGRYATIVDCLKTEGNIYQDQLSSNNTLIQSDETCKNEKKANYAPDLNEFTFCAGYGKNADPSVGNLGSGLVTGVLQPDNRISWYLIGVVSKCGMHKETKLCDADLYKVYTNVAAHALWIQHHSRGVDRGDFDKIVEMADIQ